MSSKMSKIDKKTPIKGRCPVMSKMHQKQFERARADINKYNELHTPSQAKSKDKTPNTNQRANMIAVKCKIRHPLYLERLDDSRALCELAISYFIYICSQN